ncbi:MAG: PAS domain S-box protein [Gammaproteobacteria bacterium]|nr:PAS domain S-box protein [Gammaproteobacteria bacterium]
MGELEQRKIAEAERDRNRQYLDAIFANAPVMMFLRDLEGRYVKVNRHFEETFGVRDAEVHGRGPAEIHSPEMARRIQQQDRAVLASGRTHIDEEPFRRPGTDGPPGTLLTVRFRSPPARVPSAAWAVCCSTSPARRRPRTNCG